MNFFCQWPEIEFLRQDETRVKASEALKGKEYVIFLIGASWDQKYNNFIPTMKEFYDKFHKSKNFEVITLNRGDTEEEILSDFYSPSYGTHYTLPCSPGMLEARRKKEETQQKKDEGQEKKSAENSLSKALVATDSKGFGAVRVPRRGKHGNYLLLDPAHSEVVGAALLYFFRTFSYPGVVICRNKPPVEDPQNVSPLPPPRGPYEPAVVRPKVEMTQDGHRKFTPFIKDHRCRPDVCTIAGFYRMSLDPEAETFPWSSPHNAKGPLLVMLMVVIMTIISCLFAYYLALHPKLRMQINDFFHYEFFQFPDNATSTDL